MLYSPDSRKILKFSKIEGKKETENSKTGVHGKTTDLLHRIIAGQYNMLKEKHRYRNMTFAMCYSPSNI
jgi:hypothetical protein